MTSILLVTEREDQVHQGVSRALMLARYLQVRLDILFCDPQRHHAAQADRSPARVTDDAHQFLESLRKAITAPDVEITTDAGIEGSTHEIVARKVRREHSGLVVKSAGRRRPGHRDAVDWQLVHSCPAPLLLTRGRAWHPRPRFAAAVDASSSRSPDLSADIASSTLLLGSACSALVDLVHVQPDGLQRHEGAANGWPRLQKLARELRINPTQLHLLHGEAGPVLAGFAEAREYDLLAVGVMMAMTLPVVEDCVPARLMTSVNCDLLFVKPEDQYIAA
jgi:nucleotide-binding universal stress UspA family protein